MSRWHAESCKQPDVVLVDGATVPHCRRCDRFPDLAVLKASLPVGLSTTEPPPDQPLGCLDLSWPNVDNYTVSEGTALPMGEKPSSTEELLVAPTPAKLNSPSDQMPEDTSFGQVFERRLRADEFRLLVLEATKEENPTTPIHITLEIYSDQNCPEYETVSYTWGGEEGDSSRCRPVFVGDYWDVLFQTRNCEDMLKQLRPVKRGVRLLWVDALCINQQDMKEREVQVSKMRSIYSNAQRVVVFLGAAVATAPLDVQSSQSRSRRKLEDIVRSKAKSRKIVLRGKELPEQDGKDPLCLREILQLRYFSRIWVVQELLLSPSAAFCISGVNFTADHLTGDKLELVEEAASWVKYIVRGRPNIETFEVLQKVIRCQATDPRDIIFGILGLLKDEESLTVDYSLSTKQVYLGFLGHCLLKFNNDRILLLPLSENRPQDYPSWAVPMSHPDAILQPDEGLCPTCDFVVKQKIWDVRVFGPCPISTVTIPKSDGRRCKFSYKNTDAKIDRATGALYIDLVRLLKIHRKPEILSEHGCHQQIRPGQDHIFLLGNCCLILRETERPMAFRLVASCESLQVHKLGPEYDSEYSVKSISRRTLQISFDPATEKPRLVQLVEKALLLSSNKAKGSETPPLRRDTFHLPADSLDEPRLIWDVVSPKFPVTYGGLVSYVAHGGKSIQTMRSGLFPLAGVSLRDLLALCQAIPNEFDGAAPRFAQEYVALLRRQGLKATITEHALGGGAMIELRFGPGDEAEAHNFLSAIRDENEVPGPFQHWRVDDDADVNELGENEYEAVCSTSEAARSVPPKHMYKNPSGEMRERMLQCVNSKGAIRRIHRLGKSALTGSSKSPRASVFFYLASGVNSIHDTFKKLLINKDLDGKGKYFYLWKDGIHPLEKCHWLDPRTGKPMMDTLTMLLEGSGRIKDVQDIMQPAVPGWPSGLVHEFCIDGSTYAVEIV